MGERIAAPLAHIPPPSRNSMPTILTYHHIEEPPAHGKHSGLFVRPETFERQLEYLKRSGIRVIALDALAEGLSNETGGNQLQVAITFDDGYANNYERAWPLLRRFGFPATFFITTGWIGGRHPQGAPMMDAAQIRDLASGGMEIGSHTVTHPWLGRIDREAARRELAESKATLESITGRAVRWLCYPSGSFNPAVQEIARELGYVGACSVIRDNRMHAGQLYHLPRVMVMPDTSMLRFRYYFSSLYHRLHVRKNRKRWARYL
jgi:peptidoglycan/xylan/chitin deacetylase (PgdA/CDA1 family)